MRKYCFRPWRRPSIRHCLWPGHSTEDKTLLRSDGGIELLLLERRVGGVLLVLLVEVGGVDEVVAFGVDKKLVRHHEQAEALKSLKK